MKDELRALARKVAINYSLVLAATMDINTCECEACRTVRELKAALDYPPQSEPQGPDLISETESWLRYGKEYRWSEGLMYYLSRVRSALAAAPTDGGLMRTALEHVRDHAHMSEKTRKLVEAAFLHPPAIPEGAQEERK